MRIEDGGKINIVERSMISQVDCIYNISPYLSTPIVCNASSMCNGGEYLNGLASKIKWINTDVPGIFGKILLDSVLLGNQEIDFRFQAFPRSDLAIREEKFLDSIHLKKNRDMGFKAVMLEPIIQHHDRPWILRRTECCEFQPLSSHEKGDFGKCISQERGFVSPLRGIYHPGGALRLTALPPIPTGAKRHWHPALDKFAGKPPDKRSLSGPSHQTAAHDHGDAVRMPPKGAQNTFMGGCTETKEPTENPLQVFAP